MAGSNSTSTREKLLGLVDDIELITKEIFENAIAPKVLQFFFVKVQFCQKGVVAPIMNAKSLLLNFSFEFPASKLNSNLLNV